MKTMRVQKFWFLLYEYEKIHKPIKCHKKFLDMEVTSQTWMTGEYKYAESENKTCDLTE